MKREITNRIRWAMDECLPRFIRDANWFMYPFFYFAYRGKNIGQHMRFKKLVYQMTEQEYQDFYRNMNSISRNRDTDLCESNIRCIIDNIDPHTTSIIDIGCDNGYLLHRIDKAIPAKQLTGVDLEDRLQFNNISFIKSSIEKLPFPDASFDTVICTHTIEHVMQLEQAIQELIRIARKQVIIVTPCQRYYFYTLDEHINFFYRKEDLLKFLPLEKYQLKKLDMDWVYIGGK